MSNPNEAPPRLGPKLGLRVCPRKWLNGWCKRSRFPVGRSCPLALFKASRDDVVRVQLPPRILLLLPPRLLGITISAKAC